MILAEQFDSLPAQTKSFDDVIDLLWFLQAPGLRLFLHNYIDVDVGMDKRRVGCLLNVTLQTDQTMFLNSLKDRSVLLGLPRILSLLVCLDPDHRL